LSAKSQISAVLSRVFSGLLRPSTQVLGRLVTVTLSETLAGKSLP
jgi:hypothetical protein